MRRNRSKPLSDHEHDDPRIGFAGTPAFAATALRHLMAAGYRPDIVLTQPDRPAGRGRKLRASPVKQMALSEGLTVAQPDSLKDPQHSIDLQLDQLDVLIVAAYGLLLPQHVLDGPRRGCVNIHASLLPRWRGAAPIVWAIAEGDDSSGVCLMQMERGLDTGPVLAEQATRIRDVDTAATLHDRLAQLGGDLLVRHLPAIVRGEVQPVAQDDAASTYARKLTREDGDIDWSLDGAIVDRRIRAFNPYPGSVAMLGEEPIKLWNSTFVESPHGMSAGSVLSVDDEGIVVACGTDAVRLTQVQRPGKGKITALQLTQQIDIAAHTFGNAQ
ncbi:MAG: methionyl-tRNA formyltransferase [Pseudomonadota bacterium]